jgi:signal transduction histidine kinase
MHSLSLQNLLNRHKEYILKEMRRRLGHLPRSPYQKFILRSREGQRRLKTWLTLVIRTLDGGQETFFKDEERVGYYRAVQGFHIDFSFQIHQCFRQILGEILRQEAARKRINVLDFWQDIQELHEVISQGYSIIASSFLKTREELITEKVTYLQEIYNLTRKLITLFDLQEIVTLTLTQISGFFGTEEGFILLAKENRIQGIYSFPPGQETSGIRNLLERVMGEGIPLFMDEGKELHPDIERSQLKRMVAVPIQAHGRGYGVLALHNRKRGFKFTEKEMGLLTQLLYIVAVALENAFMLEEIEQGRQELRLLTGKIITIQEEERKRLAADIHDTLAQALTGIGYKIQFCKELVAKEPALLMNQLDSLLHMVHQAIDQSKELMATLRPDLIDTIGLVPALKRHMQNFTQETGIQVKTHMPKKMQMPSAMNICLFRVAQEALMNVYKHSGAKNVKIDLQKANGDLLLVVADDGKGFDVSPGGPTMKDPNKLGLLSMKERLEAVGGSLAIDTGVDRGCRIVAKIPLRKENGHGKN